MKAMFIQVNKCPVTTQSSHSAQERMATPLQSPYSTTLNQLLLSGGGDILALANNPFYHTNTKRKKINHIQQAAYKSLHKNAGQCARVTTRRAHISQHACFQREEIAGRLLRCSAWPEVGSLQDFEIFPFRLTQVVGSWKPDIVFFQV